MIGTVLVARMKSSRLRGKSMAPLAGRPSLEWMVRRLRQSRYVDAIVIATTTDPADDVIAELAARTNVRCFRGSEDDVLGRVNSAIRFGGFDEVVHVTGDCPLIDAGLVDEVIELYRRERPDYASLDFSAYPQGFDVEVFSAAALARIEASFSDPWIREHVTVPFYTMPDRFRAVKLTPPPDLRRPHYRICIDTEEDYAAVQAVFAALVGRDEYFPAREIVRLLDARPDIVALNAAMSEAKHNCGVIGLGNIGSLYERNAAGNGLAQTHAKAYLRYGKTRLAAGCDVDDQRRRDFVADWKVENVYADPAQMFEAEKLDIVSIATPPETHADLCLLAAAAGVKAIFCEKPFVPNAEQGRRVLQACADRGVFLAVNHLRRWMTPYRRLRDFLAAGGLGQVQAIRCHYMKGAMNSASHLVDLLHYLFGPVVAASAVECREIRGGDPDIGGTLRLADGRPVYLSIGWLVTVPAARCRESEPPAAAGGRLVYDVPGPSDRSRFASGRFCLSRRLGPGPSIGDYHANFCLELDIIGTAGRVTFLNDALSYWQVQPCAQEPGVNMLQPAAPPFETTGGSPLEAAVAELVDCVEGRLPQPACTGRDGLQAVAVVHALQRSWTEGGRWIDVPQEETPA